MTADTTDMVVASYVPGPWVAVAGRRTWLLADLDPASEEVALLWALQRRDADHLEMLDALTRIGLAHVSSFALASITGTTSTVLVRGSATARVGAGADAQEVTAKGLTTWVEHQLEGCVTQLELMATTDTVTGMLPLSGGVVGAGKLLLQFGSAPAAAAVRTELADVQRRPAEATLSTMTASLTRDFRATNEGAIAAISVADAPSPPVEGPGEPAVGYDHLFGETVQRNVEDAAVREQADLPGANRAAKEELATPTLPTPAPEMLPSSHARELIDRVPWAPVSPDPANPQKLADVGPPATAVLAEDDSEGRTVSRDVQRQLVRREAPAAHLAGLGPTVHAVHCPEAHPNPTHAVVCRVCGAELPQRAPVTVPRPVLGVLMMSTGDVITLDRGVLMGRNPSSNRLVGGERPHLVKIPSPDKDISRNHLEIRLDGWHVLVTDLNSTNGTLVTLPDREPERLRPDVSAPIEPGTIVSLGDEASFRFEVVE